MSDAVRFWRRGVWVSLAALLLALLSLAPYSVSYTHLDVYKRQNHAWPHSMERLDRIIDRGVGNFWERKGKLA